MQISFTRSNGETLDFIERPKPSTDTYPKLGWLISDYELYGMSRPEKNNSPARIQGLPMTERYFDATRTDISKGTDTRKFAFDVFAKNAPEYLSPDALVKRFDGVMKDGTAFTDFTGGNGYNQIITCNNYVEILGDKTRTINGNNTKDFWYPVRVLKVGKYNFMRDQLEKYPLLAFNATISTREHGGRGVIPFWHLDGRDVKVVPLFKSDVNYLPAERIRLLADGETVNSYFPPR